MEDELNRLFPNATTVRMDMDTTGKKQSHEKILQKFEKIKSIFLSVRKWWQKDLILKM